MYVPTACYGKRRGGGRALPLRGAAPPASRLWRAASSAVLRPVTTPTLTFTRWPRRAVGALGRVGRSPPLPNHPPRHVSLDVRAPDAWPSANGETNRAANATRSAPPCCARCVHIDARRGVTAARSVRRGIPSEPPRLARSLGTGAAIEKAARLMRAAVAILAVIASPGCTAQQTLHGQLSFSNTPFGCQSTDQLDLNLHENRR